jgi:nucleoid-associated protein YgaU
MGEPAARWYASQSGAGTPAIQLAGKASKLHPAQTATTPDRGGLRLVPDFAAANPNQRVNEQQANVAPPALMREGTDSSADATSASVVPSIGNHSDLSIYTARARLRDEAPRPLDIAERAPAGTESAPPAAQANPDASNTSFTNASADWPTTASLPTSFDHYPDSIATISASYKEPMETPRDLQVTAPPLWPSPDEAVGPKTHIIVDGDSLERLAGRYLDDPRRSNEIYDANRELLASPDLLPIGAELVIPNRSTARPFEAHSPQSSVSHETAIHAASHSRLVPVRPVPSTAGVMPRAQLLRPLAVE